MAKMQLANAMTSNYNWASPESLHFIVLQAMIRHDVLSTSTIHTGTNTAMTLSVRLNICLSVCMPVGLCQHNRTKHLKRSPSTPRRSLKDY